MNHFHSTEEGCKIVDDFDKKRKIRQKKCLTHKKELSFSGFEWGWWQNENNRTKNKTGVPKQWIKIKCKECGKSKMLKPSLVNPTGNYCNMKCFHKYYAGLTRRVT